MYKLRKKKLKKIRWSLLLLKIYHVKEILNCANHYNNVYNFSYIKTENEITVLSRLGRYLMPDHSLVAPNSEGCLQD